MTVSPFNAIDRCIFNAASAGTGDFVVASAVVGYQTPAAAAAVNGEVYSYAAQSNDLTQWEVGQGAYTVGSTTQARTTVLFNSLGTTAKINFSNPPQVLLSIAAEDINNLTVASVIAGSGADVTQDGGKLVLEDTYRTLQSSAYWGADNLGCRHWWLKSRGASIGTHAAVQSGDDVAALYFGGSDGTAWQVAAHIHATCDGTVGGLTVPGRLSFWTSISGSQFPLERVRIDSAGRVIIGGFASTINDHDLEITRIGGGGLGFINYNYGGVSNPIDLAWFNTRGATPTTQSLVGQDNLGIMRWLGSDGTAFRTAVSITMRVDGAPGAGSMPGRIEIGTTPSGSTGSVERVRIDNAGSVMIGGGASQTYGASGGAGLGLQINGLGDYARIGMGRWVNDQFETSIRIGKSRSGTIGTHTIVQSGDIISQFAAFGSDGTQFIPLALMSMEVDGTPGANDMPGRILFFTTPDGSAVSSERLRITNQGQVWIANTTAVPAAGGTVATTAMALQFGSAANFGIFVGSGVPTVAAATGSLYLRTDGTTTTTRIYVRTNSSTWAFLTTST